MIDRDIICIGDIFMIYRHNILTSDLENDLPAALLHCLDHVGVILVFIFLEIMANMY